MEVSKSPTFGETVLSLTDTDEFLERALFLYGTVEHDWRGLYMVLDVVAESYNGPKELLKQDFVANTKATSKTSNIMPTITGRLGWRPGTVLPKRNRQRKR
jgi:hypothetical protein